MAIPAACIAVGAIPRRAERLIEVTYEAMMRGIAAIRPGATTGDIGHAIQDYVEAQHMSVVRDFCGHGLGRLFHDEPNIVHVGRPGEGIVLRPGMFFTVEPMINLGRPHVKVLSDGWTAVTRDRSLSAQFEHTVAVTERRRRDLHAVAERPREAALRRPGLTVAFPHRARCKLRQSRHAEGIGGSQPAPIVVAFQCPAAGNPAGNRSRHPRRRRRRRTITAIASGCGSGCCTPGPRRFATTNCSN